MMIVHDPSPRSSGLMCGAVYPLYIVDGNLIIYEWVGIWWQTGNLREAPTPTPPPTPDPPLIPSPVPTIAAPTSTYFPPFILFLRWLKSKYLKIEVDDKNYITGILFTAYCLIAFFLFTKICKVGKRSGLSSKRKLHCNS